jgi:hypothetical protein
MSFPTTFDSETELSSVNSILGIIGQAPITSLEFTNPEVSFIYQLLQEASKDIQNEGWVFNTELGYPLERDENKKIAIPNNMLRLDVSDGQKSKFTNPIKRNGFLYDKVNHTFDWEEDLKADIVWFFPYEDLPSAFKRYATYKAGTRAATQMVGNPQLVQLLAAQELQARTSCMEYECNQGDYNMFGFGANTSYTAYKPHQGLNRVV